MSLFRGGMKLKAYISPHWLTITLPIRALTGSEFNDKAINAENEAIIDQYCLELFGHSYRDFERLSKSRNAYRDCRTFHGLVNIYKDSFSNCNGTACFEFTGDGIETLGLSIAEIGAYALEHGGNVARIDVQCLDTGNYLPYAEILECCSGKHFKDRVRTRFNRGRKATDLPRIETQPYRRIVFGSPKSDNYLVVYDRQQVEDLDFPCLNLEMRISNRADCRAIIEALNTPGTNEGEYFAGMLRGKIEFLEDQPGKSKEYRSTCAWWSDFLGSVSTQKIKRTKRNSRRFADTTSAKARKQAAKLADQCNLDALKLLQQQVDEDIRLLEMKF